MEEQLAEILKEYLKLYPAFRVKPIGAPGSKARQEQEYQIELEDRVKELLYHS